MKKNRFLAWIITIACFILLMTVILSALFYIYITILYKDDPLISNTDYYYSVYGIVIFLVISVYGLRKGLSFLKKTNKKTKIPYSKVFELNLSGRVKYDDYKKTILQLSLKRRGFVILLLLMSIPTFLISKTETEKIYDQYFPVAIMLIFITVIVYSTFKHIRKTYRTTKAFQETLNYRLTNDIIDIKGESVESSIKWEHFLKFDETKEFFLLYSNTTTATFLDKKMFTIKELNEFKSFLKSI